MSQMSNQFHLLVKAHVWIYIMLTIVQQRWERVQALSQSELFEKIIRGKIEQSIAVKQHLLSTSVKTISSISQAIVKAYREGRGVYWFGNGGSAADAQHLACELVNRFYIDRKGLRSQAFTVNTSILTAVSNDYTYEYVFEKQVEAFAGEGDVLIGISTSGNAQNVIRAFELGRKIGTINVGFSGSTGGNMKNCVDHLLAVPSDDTPAIQECHITAGHIICYIVEQTLFGGEEVS
jgi:D-sedoheptulose 7-phosphate isomerase